MRSPRFTVGSVTGYAIGPTAGRVPNRPPSVIWYVHDSAFCYRVVAEFHSYYGRSPYDRYDPELVGERAPTTPARDFAERYAAALEASHS